MAGNSWAGFGYGGSAGGPRRKYFGCLKELGITRTSAQDCEYLSILLGRPLASRSQITDPEWEMAANTLSEAIKTLRKVKDNDEW